MCEPEQRIGAVVVTYNCVGFITETVQTALAEPWIGELVVVDNASTDGTVEVLRALEDAALKAEGTVLRIALLPENIGFGAATNLGVEHISSELLLVLNPDVVVGPATDLERLAHEFRVLPRMSILGCGLWRPDGSFDHASKRMEPTVLSALDYFVGRRFGRGPGGYEADSVSPTGSGLVDAVNGAFMLMRRRDFVGLGGFDTGFFMYAEDLDLCRRARQRGGAVRFDGAARAIHMKGASDGGRRAPATARHFWTSMYRYRKKHARRPWLAAIVSSPILAIAWIAYARAWLDSRGPSVGC